MRGLIGLIGGLLLIALLGVAIKNGVDFRADCHAKGGVVLETTDEYLCVKKEAIIK